MLSNTIVAINKRTSSLQFSQSHFQCVLIIVKHHKLYVLAVLTGLIHKQGIYETHETELIERLHVT